MTPSPGSRDADAVEALIALGFRRPAALAALEAVGWRGETTADRVLAVLKSTPVGLNTTERHSANGIPRDDITQWKQQ